MSDYYQKYMKYKNKYLKLKMGGSNNFTLSSNSFKHNTMMPIKYTKYSSNISPELKINNLPEKTKSIILLVSDPDSIKVAGKRWIHLFINDLSKEKYLQGELNQEQNIMKNDFNNNTYDGPQPPKNTGVHKYIFEVFALDKNIEFDKHTNYTYDEIIEKINNNLISKTQITGLFSN
jgi:Raf kinase inhibitor-like YbhB/YbcL family protein